MRLGQCPDSKEDRPSSRSHSDTVTVASAAQAGSFLVFSGPTLCLDPLPGLRLRAHRVSCPRSKGAGAGRSRGGGLSTGPCPDCPLEDPPEIAPSLHCSLSLTVRKHGLCVPCRVPRLVFSLPGTTTLAAAAPEHLRRSAERLSDRHTQDPGRTRRGPCPGASPSGDRQREWAV